MLQSATASTVRVDGDYQQFDLDRDGRVVWACERMALKAEALQATGLPQDFCNGRSVLEIGTDHGFWAFLASSAGARKVLALDRNRFVKGRGPVDLVAENNALARSYPLHARVHFRECNLGAQWHEFGRFDVVLCMSVAHHIYAQCGDHAAVWYWLYRHVAPGGLLIWEGPVDASDPVIRKDVPEVYRGDYNATALYRAASRFFDVVEQGPALHEPHREVWVLRRGRDMTSSARGDMLEGAKGATRAFLRDGARRIEEIEDALGARPVPGSLNCWLDQPFDWETSYYRAQIADSTNRRDPNAPWAPRWCRFYPVTVGNVGGWAMRFENERYDPRFIEIIGPHRFRDLVQGSEVILCRSI